MAIFNCFLLVHQRVYKPRNTDIYTNLEILTETSSIQMMWETSSIHRNTDRNIVILCDTGIFFCDPIRIDDSKVYSHLGFCDL